jgi:5-oxoprolinase (ATP-hydrolysing) subunit A
VNINSDLGEGAGHDEEILPFIDSANVGCALHAGSASITIATGRRCRELGVQVGAHPGFDDRENYGRVELPLSASEIADLVRYQVGALAAVAEIGYVKPHGALYHRCQSDPEAAREVVKVCSDFGVGIMGQPGFALIEEGRNLGIPIYREGFADRAYLPDGRLAPRTQPGSVLDPEAAGEQAIRMARSGDFDTICLHGDSPGAEQVARSIREALRAAGIQTSHLRA